MSSRGAFPKMGDENIEWSSRLPPTEPRGLSTSRKRPRRDESPRYDSNSENDRKSRKFSFSAEGYGVRDTYIPARDHVPRMGRHYLTTSPVDTAAEELKSQAMSATPTETGFERDADGDDTRGSPQPLPPRFGAALDRLNQELKNLDGFFFYSRKVDAVWHIDKINDQLNIMEDSHRRLYSDFCNQRDEKETFQDELSRLRDQTKAEAHDMELLQERFDELESSLAVAEKERSTLSKEVDDLKMKIANSKKITGGQIQKLRSEKIALAHERDQAKREIENLKKDTARLDQSVNDLIREKTALEVSHEQSRRETTELETSIKDFEREKTELDTYIKDLEYRNESLKSEKEKLEAVVEAKNAEIEALKASPAPAGRESNGTGFYELPEAMVPPVSSAPGALIKDEARDPLPQSLSLSVPPAHTTPLESPAVAYAGDYYTHYKYDQLGFGVSSFLSNLLQIDLAYDQPLDRRRLESVVTEFMFNLGAFIDTADVAVSPVEGFWQLCLPWTSKPIIGMAPRPSIEERFVQLCFLIPHLKSRSQGRIWWTTVQLINSLMNADHASAPRAGMAFLATMTSTNLAVEIQNLDVQNTALAIALCELCRFLQETFTELPKPTWNIGNVLGPEVQGAVVATPFGRLSACLANPYRSNTSALREQLATTCGDEFCFVSLDEPNGDKRELGFLSCGDSETFLILNFAERSVRFVDRNFAYALHDEDQKKHLLIKRPGGEVLLDITGVAQDVRVFWVKYAEHP